VSVKVQDSGDLRHYRTEIPNLVLTLGLSPFELALYVHLKRTAGDGGRCWKSTVTLAEETGMSAGMVSKAKEGLERPRKELAGKPLIVVAEEANPNGGKPRHVITLADVWPENVSRFAQPSSRGELASSPRELASSRGELKKEPSEETLSTRAREAVSAFAEVYGHEPHNHGQTEIETEIRERGPLNRLLWREVLRQCKANLTPAKNVGTILKMYREQLARQSARGSPPGPAPPPKPPADRDAEQAQLKRKWEQQHAKPVHR
jgi:hypothetical protein